MRRLPPLSSLPAFEATARLGSVTAAAEELGRTHSAVSKQIAHLSDDLGGGLFEKSGNGLKLTVRGERLRKSASELLDELDRVGRQLRGEVDESHVDLLMSATLATRWLIPHLPAFYAQHPAIEIRLRMAGHSWVPEHEVDIAISYDRLRGRTKEDAGIPIGDTAYGPVCAPGYALRESDGAFRVGTTLTNAGAAHSWREWGQRAGVALVADHDLEHPHHVLALEAAAAGLGLALAERRLVAQDLASGRLIAPFGFTTVTGGLRASVSPHAAHKKSVRQLLAWLEDLANA